MNCYWLLSTLFLPFYGSPLASNQVCISVDYFKLLDDTLYCDCWNMELLGYDFVAFSLLMNSDKNAYSKIFTKFFS
jgi:hypothetical protein